MHVGRRLRLGRDGLDRGLRGRLRGLGAGADGRGLRGLGAEGRRQRVEAGVRLHLRDQILEARLPLVLRPRLDARARPRRARCPSRARRRTGCTWRGPSARGPRWAARRTPPSSWPPSSVACSSPPRARRGSGSRRRSPPSRPSARRPASGRCTAGGASGGRLPRSRIGSRTPRRGAARLWRSPFHRSCRWRDLDAVTHAPTLRAPRCSLSSMELKEAGPRRNTEAPRKSSVGPRCVGRASQRSARVVSGTA